MKLLIATTNKGKLKEIRHIFSDADLELLSLADVEKMDEPLEDAGTVEGNALIKAKYYAEKTGMVALADDSGFFIPALNNWPGAEAAYVCEGSDADKRACILKKMEGIEDRAAYWLQASALYDPIRSSAHITYGRTDGVITTEDLTDVGIHTYGFNGIFRVDGTGKTYAEMGMAEKNANSHRGKALQQMRYHLSNTYNRKSIVVPLALIVKDGKLLMNLRNDPHNPAYHQKWEFPGGGVRFRETPDEAVIREAKEETGLDLQIVEKLGVYTEFREEEWGKLQLYLLPYICSVRSGDLSPSDSEVLESRWFSLDNVLKEPLLGNNAELFTKVRSTLDRVVSTNNL